MSNKITIEFSAEDRARLDKLQAILEAIGESIGTKAVFVELGTGGDEPEAAPAESKPATTEAPKSAPVAQTEPSVKLADIQQLVVTLSTKGKKAEVRDIIKAHAERVTALPEDKWPEVFEKLKALEV